jgi:hypothetical protein
VQHGLHEPRAFGPTLQAEKNSPRGTLSALCTGASYSLEPKASREEGSARKIGVYWIFG